MKKLIVFAIVCVMAIGAQAQTVTEGTKIFNPTLTNLGYNNVTVGLDGFDEDFSLSRVGLSLAAGYAVKDDLIVKGEIAYQGIKFEDMKVSLVSIGAGARTYVLIPNLFVGAGLNYTKGTAKNYDEYTDDITRSSSHDSSASINFVDLRLEAGYSLFVTDNIAVEPSVTYGMKIAGGSLGKGDDDDSMELNYSHLSFNVGFSLFF